MESQHPKYAASLHSQGVMFKTMALKQCEGQLAKHAFTINILCPDQAHSDSARPFPLIYDFTGIEALPGVS